MSTETIKTANKMTITFGKKDVNKKKKFIQFLKDNQILHAIDGEDIIFEENIPQINTNDTKGCWIKFNDTIKYHVHLSRDLTIKKGE